MGSLGTFVTLVPESKNIDLVKDVGQIPYTLANSFDVDASYASCHFDLSGSNMDVAEKLKLIPLTLRFRSHSITGLLYIIKNAKKIDWLNIYHAGRESLIWTAVYKLLNPKGKVYLKLDLDFRSCEKYDNNKREKMLFARNVHICDLTTVETKAVWERIQSHADREIKVLGNGFSNSVMKPVVSGERKNTFLTVGRLGTRQKATDVLLEAYAQSADRHDWTLKLVGSVEENFKDYIDDYYRKYPQLRDRVIFLGKIDDRQTLYRKYCEAKVFVLPSRWEGFPIVGPEAVFCGCRVIVSDQVPTAREITSQEKFGRIVPVDDIAALSEAMLAATKDEYSGKLSQEISDYASTKFAWRNICESLYNYLEECMSE